MPKKAAKFVDIQDIKFVSYSGKWPNLCSGTLVFDTVDRNNTKTRYSWKRCLTSGGYCTYDYTTSDISQGEGPWTIDWQEEYGDEHIQKEMDQFGPAARPLLLKVVNINVEHGCCGGCS